MFSKHDAPRLIASLLPVNRPDNISGTGTGDVLHGVRVQDFHHTLEYSDHTKDDTCSTALVYVPRRMSPRWWIFAMNGDNKQT